MKEDNSNAGVHIGYCDNCGYPYGIDVADNTKWTRESWKSAVEYAIKGLPLPYWILARTAALVFFIYVERHEDWFKRLLAYQREHG